MKGGDFIICSNFNTVKFKTVTPTNDASYEEYKLDGLTIGKKYELLAYIDFSDIIFIAIVGLYIHRVLKGDFKIVTTEVIAAGHLRDSHTGHISGNFYDTKTTYKSGRVKYSKAKLH